MPKTTAHFSQIKGWLNEIHREKTASAKKAKAMSEPGGYDGETTHPVKDVDDGLMKATEGSRAAENEADIKKMVPAGNMEEGEVKSKTQEELNLNIGLHQSGTGEDASVEDDYKDRPSDPGTTAKADTSVGPKYSAWVQKQSADLANLANEILADIAVGAGVQTKTAAPAKTGTKTASQTTQPTTTPEQAAQAGYELASALGLNKEAADQVVENCVAQTIKEAQNGADRVGAYLTQLHQDAQKRAADADDANASGGATDEPPMGPEAGGGGEDPTAALAAAAQGGGGGPPGGGGEMPPDAGQMMGGGAGGPQEHEQAMQQLIMSLLEMGISPQELEQAIAQDTGGMGGGAGAGGPGMGAGGGGGSPPMMPPPDASAGAGLPPSGGAEMGAKIASEIRKFQRSGKFKISEAKTAAERAQRDEMKSYVLEIINRR